MEDNHSKNSVPGDSTDLTTVKGEKTGIPKWLMVTVIAMAAVIVGLTVTLVAVIAGKSWVKLRMGRKVCRVHKGRRVIPIPLETAVRP